MNEDLEIIFDLAKDSMSNAISHLEKKLLNIRAGKANPNMLSNVLLITTEQVLQFRRWRM